MMELTWLGLQCHGVLVQCPWALLSWACSGFEKGLILSWLGQTRTMPLGAKFFFGYLWALFGWECRPQCRNKERLWRRDRFSTSQVWIQRLSWRGLARSRWKQNNPWIPLVQQRGIFWFWEDL
jgi:hypothetical protein